MTKHEHAQRVFAIVNVIKPHLAGNPPGIQGAVLCELVALWLAGHAPDLRNELLLHHVEHVVLLTGLAAADIRGEGETKH